MKPSQGSKIFSRFLKKNRTLAVAESCTGGRLCSLITSMPGSSAFFYGGVVSYSNKAKSAILKINPSIISKHGAVSSVVAKQMARNVRRLFAADYGVGITGIAGPGGGTVQKPVGLVWIAISGPLKTIVYQNLFKGQRLRVQEKAVKKAVEYLKSALG